MTHGLRTYNDGGYVQIDEDLLALVETGTGYAGATPNGFLGLSNSPLGMTYTEPFAMFAKPDGYGIWCGYFFPAVGSGFSSGGPPPWSDFGYIAVGGGFTWKSFSHQNDPGLSDGTPWGLQVYGSDGAVKFDSRRTYMQVKAVFRCYDQATPYYNFTVPAEAEWFSLNDMRGNIYFGDANQAAYFFQRVDATTVQVACINLFEQTYADSFSVDMPPIVLMAAKI